MHARDEEEIGTSRQIFTEHRNWLYYDIPSPLADRLWDGSSGPKTKVDGSSFHVGKDQDININTENPEFCEWRWLNPDELVRFAVPFKRKVYDNVLDAFKNLI